MHEQDSNRTAVGGFNDDAARRQFLFLPFRHNYELSIISQKEKGNPFDIVRARRLGFQKYERG